MAATPETKKPAMARRFQLERMTGVEPYLTDAIKPLNTSDLAALTA